jgi:site-specific DNA-methyltransferase (adenine-specific)
MPQLDLVFDGIFCDLPYGTTACSWDTIIPFESLWENYKRLVKANGAVVLNASDPFTPILQMSNFKWYKYKWIWDKISTTNHLNCVKQPLRAVEEILIFYRLQPVYNPQLVQKSREAVRKNNIIVNKKHQTYGAIKVTQKKYEFRKIPIDLNYPVNLLRIPQLVANNKKEPVYHPTQKPVALLAYLIRTYTNPGEIILDNTMGSGTTLLAAQNEGRRAIGIELSEEYCKIAVDRLRQPSFFSIPDKPKIAKQKELL